MTLEGQEIQITEEALRFCMSLVLADAKNDPEADQEMIRAFEEDLKEMKL